MPRRRGFGCVVALTVPAALIRAAGMYALEHETSGGDLDGYRLSRIRVQSSRSLVSIVRSPQRGPGWAASTVTSTTGRTSGTRAATASATRRVVRAFTESSAAPPAPRST